MNIYQATDSRWLVFNNGIKSDYFNTEGEAENMASKITFATQSQTNATALAQVSEALAALEQTYFDRGYDSGGSNPITNDDIASTGITAADLANLITLIQQLNNFLANSAVTTADYGSTLNTVRNDI